MLEQLSLAQALRIIQKPDPAHRRATVTVIANFGLMQFRCFLQAYMSRCGVTLVLRPEVYNGLMPALLDHETEETDGETYLIVMDSASIGAHPSLRSPGTLCYCDGPAFERTAEEISRAIVNFRQKALGQIFILPVILPTGLFDPSVPGIMSEGRLRAMGFFAKVGAWARQNGATHMLSCVTPEINEKLFFDTGELFSTSAASGIASDVALALYCRTQGLLPDSSGGQKKLLITDLDDTFWAGTLGETGAEGIEFLETEKGRPHWLYQRFLDLLSREGVALAACSKNSPETVDAAMRDLPFACGKERFALIMANWERKSENIKAICSTLNCLPEHAVVVDDNPLELEEIAHALPGITTVLFSQGTDAVIPLLHRLRSLFLRAQPSQDVAERLASYQAMTREKPGSDGKKQGPREYADFLASLGQVLTIDSVNVSSRERVFELLNKTNQFNLTGRRTDRLDYDTLLSISKVWTFTLKDRLAEHGLIGVAVASRGQLRQCVLSCRVFSRYIEDAIVAFLVEQKTKEFLLCRTQKNGPTITFFSRILADPGLHDRLSETPQIFPLKPVALAPFSGRVEKKY